MIINNISSALSTYQSSLPADRTVTPAVQSAPNRDTFTRSEIHHLERLPAFSDTGSRANNTINNILEDNSEKITSARSLLKDFLGTDENLTSSELMDIFTDDVNFDMSEAEQLFSALSDLDWSSGSAAGMIFEMAEKISDGDPEMMSLMRSAIKDAFSEVENSFGGTGSLPHEAYDTVQQLEKMFSSL